MFTDCSGPCSTCKSYYYGGCLAGHGDDDYVYASPEWLEARLAFVKVDNPAEYARLAERAKHYGENPGEQVTPVRGDWEMKSVKEVLAAPTYPVLPAETYEKVKSLLSRAK